MDEGHYRILAERAEAIYHPKIHLFLDFFGKGYLDVADPYYGGFEGFESMFQIISEAMDIEKIRQFLKNQWKKIDFI